MRDRLRRWVRLLVLLSAAAGLLVVARLDRRVRAYLAGPALGSIRIYARPEVVRPGASVAPAALARKLARLGYRRADGAELEAGEFRATAAEVEMAQRQSPVPGADPPQRARIVFRSGRVTQLQALDGTPLDRLQLEPEMLAAAGGTGPLLEAGEIAPGACRAAVLAAEDRHFFQHPGVDPVAIVRALVADVQARARRQGGSTITQQLAKNAFLSPHRTLVRKLREAALALLLEAHASKEEILRRYLASVYLGTEGGVPIHGFAQAAEVYFGKPLADLDPAECSLLAGMIRSPNALSPRRHPHEALVRRNRVLALMAKAGLHDRSQVRTAMAEPLRLASAPSRPVAALYVADEVGRSVARLLPPQAAHAPGLAVFTAIDPDAQREAERAVRRGLVALDRAGARRARKDGQRLQAALIALDPRTGGVRALVGGRDYGSSPLDRAIRTRRQPGSAFKPFLYLAALDPLRRGDGRPWTVVTPVDDSPIAIPVGSKLWRPANYDGVYHGRVALEDAFAQSLNAATVRVAREVGIDAVVRAAGDLGIAGPLPRVPALALGVAETSLVELTAAYGVFADGGVRHEPTLVEAIVSAEGDLLYATPTREQPVIEPAVAYLVTHLMERVVDTGTARAVRASGLAGAAAGKTGTTDDTRDAWFVGFTPDVVAGVWVGFDDGAPTGFTGAAGALPIWIDFVRATRTTDPPDEFPVPDGIVWRDVDPASGLLASPACPEGRREPFLAGTEPRVPCDLHRPVWAAVGQDVGSAMRGTGRAIEVGGRRLRSWFERIFR